MTKARENSDGGLILIGSSSPTAATSVSFTNLTVGKRYRVVGWVNGNTLSTSYQIKVREGSTDKSSGYYGGAYYVQHNGNAGTSQIISNASTITLGFTEPGLFSTFEFDYKIQSATETTVNGFFFDRNQIAARYFGYMNAGTTAVNGISILISGGTFSGNIKIYEYR